MNYMNVWQTVPLEVHFGWLPQNQFGIKRLTCVYSHIRYRGNMWLS